MSTFASVLAVDENSYVANGATGKIYATTDFAATTPLDITDLNGIAFAGNELTASAIGVIPPFRCPSYNEKAVDWVSGDFRVPINAIDQIPEGGTTGQVLTKSSNNNYDAEWADPTASGGGGIVEVNYADLPAGTTLTVSKTGATWPVRPTSRPDIVVQWKGANPSPPISSTYMLNNVDIRLVTP